MLYPPSRSRSTTGQSRDSHHDCRASREVTASGGATSGDVQRGVARAQEGGREREEREKGVRKACDGWRVWTWALAFAWVLV